MFLFDLLFPGYCALCHSTQHKYNLCKRCIINLPKNIHCCNLCANNFQNPIDICGSCLNKPPLWQSAYVPFIYSDTIKFLITELKFNHKLYLSKTLAWLFAQQLNQLGKQKIEAIIAVPLHKKRLLHRKFNQSYFLAKYIGQLLNIPVLTDVAYRIKNTKSQSKLTYKQRKINIKNAFSVKNPQKIQGKHIAIVDDVYTTGATLKALSKILLRHKPKTITVWCIARSKNIYQ